MSSIAESLFLFMWAFMSNTKDLVLDYSAEIYENFVEPQVFKKQRRKLTKRERERKRRQRRERKRRKRVYFKNFRAQMGHISANEDILTGAPSQRALHGNNDTATDSQTMAALNALSALDDISSSSPSPGSNKIESLENELMKLKMELATMAKTGNTTKQASATDLAPPPPPPPPPPMPPAMSLRKKNPSNSTSIPPPPPMPSSIFSPKKEQASATQPTTQNTGPLIDVNNMPKLRPVKKEKEPSLPRSMSIADMIKSSKGPQLRSTSDVKRSPGGTPMRSKKSNGGAAKGCFQNELFAAIKDKFKSMHEQESSPSRSPRHGFFDSDESDSDSDFSFSPVRMIKPTKKMPASSPLTRRQPNPEVKEDDNCNNKKAADTPRKIQSQETDKENSPKKSQIQKIANEDTPEKAQSQPLEINRVASFVEMFNKPATTGAPRSPLRPINA